MAGKQQTHYEIDMCNGPILSKMLRFSIPLMCSSVLQLLFNAADIVVVGRWAGDNSLAAVGSNTALIGLLTNLFVGLAVGANTLAAKYYGARDRDALHRVVHTSILLSIISGLVLTVVGVFGARTILIWMQTPENVLDLATLYLRIYFLGMTATMVYNFGAALLRAEGDTQRPLYFLSLAGVVNIVLNLFFVIVCKLDVAGVAIATVISQCISASLVLRCMVKDTGPLHLDLKKMRLHPQAMRQILRIGLPAGFQNAVFAIANLFIQAGVNSFDSLMVKGNSAAANADNMIYDAMAAFYMACASFMSQNYGAGKPDRVKKSYFIALAYSFGVGLLLGGSLFIFGRQFLALFTTEGAVIDAGMKRVGVMGFAYCISAFMDCTIAASRGLGKTVVPTVIVVLGSCVFRVIWVYTIFAHFHTIPSLYLLYPCSWTLTAIAEIVYFIHAYKDSMKIFTQLQPAEV